MASAAAGWKDGKRAWLVEHDSEQGIFHLNIQGTPPEALEGIVRASRAEQEDEGGESADVDYTFDVPIDLAETIVGFRHDKSFDHGDKKPWSVYESPHGAARNGLKKLGCLPVLLLGGAALAGIIVKTTN